jgi:hypothetical protein
VAVWAARAAGNPTVAALDAGATPDLLLLPLPPQPTLTNVDATNATPRHSLLLPTRAIRTSDAANPTAVSD